jgi:Peptidase_C39 like family
MEGPSPKLDSAEPVIRRLPLVRQRFDYDRWREDGFGSRSDSETWSNRSCGIACVAMAVEYLTGSRPDKARLLWRSLDEFAAYSLKGWIHSRLVRLAADYGLHGVCLGGSRASIQALLGLVAEDQVVIASVTEQFPTDGSKGGHLVCIASHSMTRLPGGKTIMRFPLPDSSLATRVQRSCCRATLRLRG